MLGIQSSRKRSRGVKNGSGFSIALPASRQAHPGGPVQAGLGVGECRGRRQVSVLGEAQPEGEGARGKVDDVL